MDTYLPPKFSLNSFFVRHVAHPRRMKHIQGLNNSRICAVNDVGYINGLNNIDKSTNFPPNNFNESLIKSNNFEKRKEKAVPPNGIWQTFGMIDNSDKWRLELNSLASSIGLITPGDIEEMKKKKERDDMIKSLKEKTQKPSTNQSRTTSQGANKPSTSTRLNEPLMTGRRSNRFSRGSRGLGSTGNRKFLVDQADREAWMIQVLCQILQTESLVDVQSWLVSASDQEKEKVKKLIDHAMKGLEESGRIGTNEVNETIIDSNINSSINDIESTLNKIDLKNYSRDQNNVKKLTSNSNKDRIRLPKIKEDDNEDKQSKKLVTNANILKISEKEYTSPVSEVFNLNLTKTNDTSKNIDDAVLKLETPIENLDDYKIERVKVSMLVKDEKSNELREINGDWSP